MINFTTPTELNLPYLIKEGADVKLKTNHTYYTQCMLQMADTRCSVTYFVLWNPHGIVVDKIYFDLSLWNLLKEKIINYYKDYYLKSIFSTYSKSFQKHFLIRFFKTEFFCFHFCLSLNSNICR